MKVVIRRVSLSWLHAKWMTRQLLRQPSYVVSTVAFPLLFYVIFALPESEGVHNSNYLMASFSSFAVFGVVFLQFGVGTAQERSQTWYSFLKCLPVLPVDLLIARILCSAFFAFLAALGVVFMALWKASVDLSSAQWLQFSFWLAVGGFSFSVMGLAVGLWCSEKSALPVGNLIYLPLSFAGGLWKPPEILPDALRHISPYLPTRQYGELVWSVVQAKPFPENSFWGLLAWTLLFGLVALVGFSREVSRGRG